MKTKKLNERLDELIKNFDYDIKGMEVEIKLDNNTKLILWLK